MINVYVIYIIFFRVQQSIGKNNNARVSKIFRIDALCTIKQYKLLKNTTIFFAGPLTKNIYLNVCR